MNQTDCFSSFDFLTTATFVLSCIAGFSLDGYLFQYPAMRNMENSSAQSLWKGGEGLKILCACLGAVFNLPIIGVTSSCKGDKLFYFQSSRNYYSSC